ncbi:hypothetical protein TNCV_3235881 [Trichonephila clavipes]|nr:hypothetical protein TNCV_3235881 [Trichonephila clavipes]
MCTELRTVHRHLTGAFGQRWIGHGGSVNWPTRSPDLSCMDFFWGHMKSLVYETLVLSLNPPSNFSHCRQDT